MITDFFITVFTYLVEYVLYMTDYDGVDGSGQSWLVPPDWFMSLGGPAALVYTYADSMGVWFPWDMILSVLLAVVGSLLVGFGIRLARMLISHFTGGGGSA